MAAIGVDGDGSGVEEAAAGFGIHILKPLLVGGEAVNEFAVNLRLLAKDPRPAAVFKQQPDEPEQCSDGAGKAEQNQNILHVLAMQVDLAEIAGRTRAAQGRYVVAWAAAADLGEEVEVWVARDLRMLGEELRELRVGARDVLLVGEE